MLFNSLVFFLFGILFFAGWPLLRRRKNSRWIYLTAASFVFYGWWDWRYLFLLAGVGLINFVTGLGIVRWPRHRKAMLVMSVLSNLIPLGVLKYLDFGIVNVNWLMNWFGSDYHFPLTRIGMVVGISFYTFQAMSYTIDIFRGELKPTRNVFHFFAYLAMFPQLVAGPIVRAKDLLPQLEEAKPVGEAQRWDGLKLIVYGYFKKVVVADTLAPVVNAAFGSEELTASTGYWWIIMLMFSYQIYCDFSGYSDIARGLGKWLGYEFPLNFDHPYIATSFQDFWRRWHISLSTWFRDYVYIPLGGSRKGTVKGQVYMWITMLVSGLWHGAAWHFIVWAGLHSFYLSLERVTGWPKKLKSLPFGRDMAAILVFVLAMFAWVFFRAESLDQAFGVFQYLFHLAPVDGALRISKLVDNNAINVLLVIMGRQLYFHFGLNDLLARHEKKKWAPAAEIVFVAVLILTSVYMRGSGNAFIYFQF